MNKEGETMENIIEKFGYEKIFEDDDKIYYRAMHGYKIKDFFGYKYSTKDNNSQIFLYIMDKNKEYDSNPKVLSFEKHKDLRLKIIFFKKYRNFTGCGLKEAVSIVDSGEIKVQNELEYDFLKSFFLQIGFIIK